VSSPEKRPRTTNLFRPPNGRSDNWPSDERIGTTGSVIGGDGALIAHPPGLPMRG
jgi:hypothetical protein